MGLNVALTVGIAVIFLNYVSCGLKTHHHRDDDDEPRLMMSRSAIDDRRHIGQHTDGVVDIDHATEDELKFLHFKMHDSDGNHMLDGCELVKSLLHFHVEECNALGPEHAHRGTTKVFGLDELTLMIDPILSTDDRNLDGFIDYPEFILAQKSRGF